MNDLISRQAAIMHFVKAAKKYECGMFDLEEATHELWKVPSAEPPKGFWVTIERGEQGYSAGDFRCSICGKPNKCYTMTAYCPNCGAKMEGKE